MKPNHPFENIREYISEYIHNEQEKKGEVVLTMTSLEKLLKDIEAMHGFQLTAEKLKSPHDSISFEAYVELVKKNAPGKAVL